MSVCLIAPVNEPYTQPQEDDSQTLDLWMKNLRHLNATAAALQSNTIFVANVAEAKHAFAQQSSGKVARPRKTVLTGWTDIVQCQLKRFLEFPYEIRQQV